MSETPPRAGRPDRAGSAASAPKKARLADDVDLAHMSMAELLDLRSRIEQALPARDLKDIDMSRELVLQVLTLQDLQRTVLSDTDTPANQRAQVANSLSQALTNLSRLQSDVYSSERFKRLESTLIEVLQSLPRDAQEAFLTKFEAAIAGID